MSDIMADEKDSGISQVSADGLGMGGLEDKLAMLDIDSVARARRGPQAMDDMLYGTSDHGEFYQMVGGGINRGEQSCKQAPHRG